MTWITSICSVLVIAAIVLGVLSVKKIIESALTKFESILEEKLKAATEIPQVALDNYIGEIVSSVKAEIKSIKLGKKLSNSVAEEIKNAIIEKLGEITTEAEEDTNSKEEKEEEV